MYISKKVHITISSLTSCSAGAHPAIADAAAWLPIHYACDNDHLKCVKVIVNFPNQLGLSGLRPALDIARGNNHEHIVTLLEEAMQRYELHACKHTYTYTCILCTCIMCTSLHVHVHVQATMYVLTPPPIPHTHTLTPWYYQTPEGADQSSPV